jgi:hypothetical protein
MILTRTNVYMTRIAKPAKHQTALVWRQIHQGIKRPFRL